MKRRATNDRNGVVEPGDTDEPDPASPCRAGATGGTGRRPQRLPGPAPQQRLARFFDADTVDRLRHQLITAGLAHGLRDMSLYRLVLAVHEAAVNAVHHGGGHGHLLLWRHADALWCEIVDHGPGLPATYQLPTRAPTADQIGGYGLWLIHEICATVDIRTGPTGTRLLLRYPLHQ